MLRQDRNTCCKYMTDSQPRVLGLTEIPHAERTRHDQCACGRTRSRELAREINRCSALRLEALDRRFQSLCNIFVLGCEQVRLDFKDVCPFLRICECCNERLAKVFPPVIQLARDAIPCPALLHTRSTTMDLNSQTSTRPRTVGNALADAAMRTFACNGHQQHFGSKRNTSNQHEQLPRQHLGGKRQKRRWLLHKCGEGFPCKMKSCTELIQNYSCDALHFLARLTRDTCLNSLQCTGAPAAACCAPWRIACSPAHQS
jgi:hypothetical protein